MQNLRKRPTYEELINDLVVVQPKIKYPDRTATILRNSHYLSQFDGNLLDLEEQEKNIEKDKLKEIEIRKIASETKTTAGLLRTRSSQTPTVLTRIMGSQTPTIKTKQNGRAAKKGKKEPTDGTSIKVAGVHTLTYSLTQYTEKKVCRQAGRTVFFRAFVLQQQYKGKSTRTRHLLQWPVAHNKPKT